MAKYTCERCNYSTNISKNMERHNSKTKHNHNPKTVRYVQIGNFMMREDRRAKKSRKK